MRRQLLLATVALCAWTSPHVSAQAQSNEELQKQINELKSVILALKAEQGRKTKATAPVAGTRPSSPTTLASGAVPALEPGHTGAQAPSLDKPETWWAALSNPPSAEAIAHAGKPKAWYERLSIRGYTQLRGNEIITGERTAPEPFARLRNPNDSGITDKNNFTFRRVRLIIQGDIHERVYIYIQPDFGTNVANQSSGEPRLNYGQLRDAYVDIFMDDDRTTKLRFGQQKVPVGWENLQSSQNRLALDRTDAINSGLPSERDLGMTAYYTPPDVQRIWDRLAKDGQKLFGNYGAFGLGIYNGTSLNRIERNNDLMVAAMATYPFELDGLGPIFEGQVAEFGVSAFRNEFQPEIRGTGVSARQFKDERVNLHAMLYPAPFGLQAEYVWGTGPGFNQITGTIEERPLEGGYVQAMYRVDDSPVGPFIPYARLQTFKGGYKASTNAPVLSTDELEVGVEFQPIKPIEITLAYARMKRREADERRFGRAEGDVFRAQLQWNY